MSNGFQGVLLFIHYNGKAIFLATCVLLILGCLVFGNQNVSEVDAATINEKNFCCITINPGDTLCSIADEYITEEYSSKDAYIREVKSINNLQSDKLYCGATLIVPYYSAPE